MVREQLKSLILIEKGGESNYRNWGKPADWSTNGSIGKLGLSQPTLGTSWVKGYFQKKS